MFGVLAVVALIWLVFAGWVVYRAGSRVPEPPATNARPVSTTPEPVPSAFAALSLEQLREELGLARGFLLAARRQSGRDRAKFEVELSALVRTLEAQIRSRGAQP